MKTSVETKTVFRRFVKSTWMFPVTLFVLVCMLSAFQVSGSSIGMYGKILNGPDYKDSGLIFGKPQPIRSDEWNVNTLLTVAQVSNKLAPTNKNIGSGEDMTVLADVPYREWSELFKPQNWSFFVLPLEQAFAFKWWFMGYLLVVSIYFLVLQILPGRKWLAIFLGLALYFSPFVQWWYQMITLAPLFYSIFILTCLLRLLHAETTRQKVWNTVLLSYLIVAFALALYPPFQIPCVLAVAAFYIGAVIHKYGLHWRRILRVLILPMAAALAGVMVIGAFIYTRPDIIAVIQNTVYPGHRIVASGGFKITVFLAGFTSYQLQSLGAASNYWNNQSEASSFIFLWPFLLVPSVLIIANQLRKRERLAWEIVGISALMLLLCAHLFLPLPDIVGKLLLLSSVPHPRLIMAFGILGLLQFILIAREVKKSTFTWRFAAALGALTFIINAIVLWRLVKYYPHYMQTLPLAIIVLFAIAVIITLITKGKHTFAAFLYAGLAIASTIYVNPLYKGLGLLSDKSFTETMRAEAAEEPGAWASVNWSGLMNVPAALGIQSYTGTYPYPQFDYWRQLDPQDKQENIYNRFAHVIFVTQDLKSPFYLVQLDSFSVKYDPCNPIFERKIKHVLSVESLESNCLMLDRTIDYPNYHIYLYDVK